ncbi:hypothetical protein DICPUDRAFT_83097 [Dictyostelium purpureum]|uniref:Protein kinase domain-containing protein n=1 Tax=Dictyostelium purpureum TaxID=5786 RepID=F0ZYI8_DICPU|nr:uncharacterized protein DICPUDRAFT_83097 [Dictyostelium purpureum]EGC30986.1 hypothetical protein DICPUDRAFT_83097 [Dictyostelium purpureum]|eukprot:XP_003292487.1 hypothetical protein DICPUDRAFT_83097 [Dictyostelium purpureum]
MWKLASAATSKRLSSFSNSNILYGININNNNGGNNDKKKEKKPTETTNTTTTTAPKVTTHINDEKNVLLKKLQLLSKKSTDDITLVGVNNRDINHMTRLLANSGISVSKINNKLLSLQINESEGQASDGNGNNQGHLNSGYNNSTVLNNGKNNNSIQDSLSSSSGSISSSSSSSSLENTKTISSTSSSASSSPLNSYSENKINSRFNSEFNEFRVLGKGGFGIVFKCSNIYDGMEYAVKRIKVNQRIPTKELMEVRAMARLNHPNIVRYYNSWIEEEPTHKHTIDHYGESNNSLFDHNDNQDYTPSSLLATSENSGTITYITNNNNNNNTFNSTASSDFTNYSLNEKKYSLYIQMEFCKYGSLRDLLNENNNIKSINNGITTSIELGLNACREVLRQILIGLKYIHCQGIVHRDLTPDNIFICQSPFTIKIADFGLATTIDSLKTSENRKGLGTYLYSSNEQEQGGNYDQRTDLYSAAAIFFEMLSQFKTTMERSATLTKLKNTLSVSLTSPQLKLQYPKDADFIDCLIQPFLNRPNSNQIPMDNILDFPPTLENLLGFKNNIEEKQQYQQFSLLLN